MGWQPGKDNGTGDAPGSGLPGPADSLLSGFAKDGVWDSCPPSAALAVALESAAGSGQRCPGATRDELLGMLCQWQALESWAAAGKLALLRALIRDDDQPLPGRSYHSDLPDGWTKSLTHEVALALSMPAVSAENQMWLAWNLQAVLPGIGAMLANGQLTLPKARAVDQALTLLSAPDAAKAEAMVLPDLPGKTYSQVEKLAVQAAATVDPESATCPRTKPSPPMPASAPAPSSTRSPAPSPRTPGWTSTAPPPTSTSSTAPPPRPASPPATLPETTRSFQIPPRTTLLHVRRPQPAHGPSSA